jgi:hypothetical protein
MGLEQSTQFIEVKRAKEVFALLIADLPTEEIRKLTTSMRDMVQSKPFFFHDEINRTTLLTQRSR